jgi:hypothetical protein
MPDHQVTAKAPPLVSSRSNCPTWPAGGTLLTVSVVAAVMVFVKISALPTAMSFAAMATAGPGGSMSAKGSMRRAEPSCTNGRR